ncbi:MAG: hypothetical protein ABSA83_08360 [Verrucomicrobiota bacterium]
MMMPETGLTLVGMLILVALIVFLSALCEIPSGVVWNRPCPSQQEACIYTLRLIDSAKRQWALEHHKQSTDTPQGTDLQAYLGHGPNSELPSCPSDPQQTFATSYALGSVGTKPVCLIMPTSRVLPRYALIYDVIHYREYARVIRWLVTVGLVLGVILRWRHSQKKHAAPKSPLPNYA